MGARPLSCLQALPATSGTTDGGPLLAQPTAPGGRRGRRPPGRDLVAGETPASAARDHPVHEQGEDGADDRADDARGLERSVVEVLVEEDEAEEATHERADDAEDDRPEHAHRVR